MSSFVFDYLIRLGGRTHMSIATVNAIPAPARDELRPVIAPARAILSQSTELRGLLPSVTQMDDWEIASLRADVDGLIAMAYGLTLEHYAAVFSAFPNLDRSEPMLPGEPKCFATRDLALAAFCEQTGSERPDVAKLMRTIGSGLPDPRSEFRYLESRIEEYRKLGATPYRPTARGARTPTDPSVIEDVLEAISGDPSTAVEIAEIIGEDESVVATIVKQLKKGGAVFSEGRGKGTRYYRLEDD
jgi:hypothetical protein